MYRSSSNVNCYHIGFLESYCMKVLWVFQLIFMFVIHEPPCIEYISSARHSCFRSCQCCFEENFREMSNSCLLLVPSQTCFTWAFCRASDIHSVLHKPSSSWCAKLQALISFLMCSLLAKSICQRKQLENIRQQQFSHFFSLYKAASFPYWAGLQRLPNTNTWYYYFCIRQQLHLALYFAHCKTVHVYDHWILRSEIRFLFYSWFVRFDLHVCNKKTWPLRFTTTICHSFDFLPFVNQIRTC